MGKSQFSVLTGARVNTGSLAGGPVFLLNGAD